MNASPLPVTRTAADFAFKVYGNQALALNPENRMNVQVNEQGFQLRADVGSQYPGFSLQLKGIHKGQGNLQTNSVPAACTDLNYLLQDFGAYQTEYINNESGLRQNFIIEERPQGDQPLRLEFQTATQLLTALSSGTGLEFIDHKGRTWMRYNDLKVWDANGKVLNAHMEATQNGDFAIIVHDQAAQYPIVVDPILTTYSRRVESDQASANMGFALSTAGDLNGDGYSDAIIGAPFFDLGQTDEGVVFVFYGSSTGLSAVANDTLQMNQANARFGVACATAGDVNGDGFSDIIVGASRYDNGSIDEGAAFVFHGSASGVSNTPAVTLESNQLFGYMGNSVTTIGDANDDGYSDIAVGVVGYDNGQTDEGAVFIYYGTSTGIPVTVGLMLESNQVSASFGSIVAAAGNVNGDAYMDLLVGAPMYDNGQVDEGRGYVYLGSATGILAAGVTLENNVAGAMYGSSANSAGDVNADGYSEVAFGSTTGSYTYVYAGGASGTNGTPALTLNVLSSSLAFGDFDGGGYADLAVGNQSGSGMVTVYPGLSPLQFGTVQSLGGNSQANSGFGYAVSSGGDYNGDGITDLLVGSPYWDNGSTDEGAFYAYNGGGGFFLTSDTRVGTAATGYLGYENSISTAGDVNADGYADIIAGAFNATNGQANEGMAYVYLGDANGVSATASFTLEANQVNASYGYAVSTAGDINNDGYSDVIVGANYYDNGQANEGAAFVYLGSPAGIISTPVAVLESNQASARFGERVCSAGDVNADGYADVLVGAPAYANGQTQEGAVYLFLGGSGGLSATAAAIIEGNQVNQNLGYKISAAGDINGDGFGDFIIGAPNYTNGQTSEGAVWVYYGNATGINPTPLILESNVASLQFGFLIAGGGDINGDGFSDIACTYSGYTTIRVHHGSASGLSLTHATTVPISMNSMSILGDVNGDGYSDLAIGEPTITVYQGSPTGLLTTAAQQFTPPGSGSGNGDHVVGAGDVNGDGFADLLTGDYTASSNAGQIYIYHIRPQRSIQCRPRQYQGDLTTPLVTGGALTGAQSGFGLIARSTFGRVLTKMVWEVKGQGQPFSGTPMTGGVAFSAQGASFTNPGLTGTEFKHAVTGAGFQNKIRVRQRFEPRNMIDGQVYSRWHYLGINDRTLPSNLGGCAGSSPTISGLGTSYCSSASSVTMTGNPGGGTFSGPGVTGNTFNPATAGIGSHTITYTITGSCTVSSTQTVTVVTLPAQPGTIAGDQDVCTAIAETYSITAVPGAATYTWTMPAGWTGTSTTNSISTTPNATGGTITVTANNACGSSTPRTLVVTSGSTAPATPGTVSGSSTVCQTSVNTYSITAVPGAASYIWTLPGSWTGSSTTNSISATAGGSNGNITVAATNGCGTSSTSTLPVTVSPTPNQPGTISGSATVCQSSSNTYSITAVGGATSYTWTLPGGWTGSSTSTSISTTAGSSSGNITVSADNACGASVVQTLPVTVSPTPAQPGTIGGSTSVCQTSANTYSITAVPGATSYTWTLPGGWTGSSTTTTISATAGSTGGNITVSATNACGTSTVQTLAVAVSPTPVQPGGISGSNTVCQNSSNTYSVNAVGGATSYTWTLPGGWSGTSTTNSITVIAGATGGNITVAANNACGSSAASTLGITVNATPVQPGSISGATTVCQSAVNTYSISTVAGATSYTWTLPGGWTGSSTSNAITATPGASSGTIIVTANNACGSSSAQTLAVTVGALPAQPGTIGGNTAVCQGSTNTYSVNPVGGATGYVWTIPGGWSGSSITNSITVTAGASAGNITVTASNACGSSPTQTLPVTIATTPGQPGTITGSSTVCTASTNSYTVAAVPGATSYTWTLPGGWTGSSTTNSISATAGTNGTITVSASNACGTSTVSSLPVTVTSTPAQPGSITGSTTVCQATATTYSIATVAGATSYTWTLPGGWSGSSTSNTISATPGATGGTITVTANNTCGASPAQPLAISVGALPAQPSSISGNNAVCQSSSNTYSIPTVAGATSYTWTLPGGWSGTSTSASITATAGSSSGNITVTADNGCGASTPQVLAVAVTATPSQPGTINGNISVCPGSSLTYSINPVAGATSYTWTLPGGWTGTSTTTSINTVAGANGGTVMVTAGNTCGSSSSQTLAVSIAGAPTQPGTISGASAVCANASVTYTITPVPGASSYVWTLPSGWTGSSTGTSITVTTGATGGNIEVSTVNGCGTSVPQSLSVSANPTPATPSISNAGPTTFCDGGSVTLISSAPSGNTWIPGGETTASIVVTTSGTFAVTTTQNGCVSASSNTVTVVVSPTPATPVISPNGPINFCQGGSATLLSNASSGNIWSPGGQTSTSIVVTASGTYTVQQVQNGCSSAVSQPVVVVSTLTPATPTISPAGPIDLCDGSSITLVSNATTGNIWTPGGETTASISATASGSYAVSAVNNGCTSAPSASVIVTVHAIPTVSINIPDDTVCSTSGVMSLGGSPLGGTFAGSGVSTTGVFTPSAAGVGSHIVTYSFSDAFGCGNTVQEVIVVEVCTGREAEAEAFGLSVAPNPTLDQVVLQVQKTGLKEVRVLSMLGVEVVAMHKMNGQSQTIDLSGLAAGIYVVEVHMGSRTERVRVVRQ